MGHTEVAESPRKSRGNGQGIIIVRTACLGIMDIAQREITCDIICIVNNIAHSADGIDTKDNDAYESHSHYYTLDKVGGTCSKEASRAGV